MNSKPNNNEVCPELPALSLNQPSMATGRMPGPPVARAFCPPPFLTLYCAAVLAITAATASAGWFAPEAGVPGSTAIWKDAAVFVNWANGHAAYQPGGDVEAAWQTPAKAYGKADAEVTSYEIACLGNGGSITLFFPHPICDGPGADFAVFENGISDYFLELAFVEVSSDGTHFVRFPAISATAEPVGPYDPYGIDATDLDGLAGKYRRGFGTPFDLAGLPPAATLDLQHIRFVRIVDIIGNGATPDSRGWPIFDPTPTVGSGGFDLDAIGVIHQNAGAFRVTRAAITPQGFALAWDSNPGSTYQIMESTDLKSWRLAETLPGNPTAATTQVLLPMTASPAKFWQIVRP